MWRYAKNYGNLQKKHKSPFWGSHYTLRSTLILYLNKHRYTTECDAKSAQFLTTSEWLLEPYPEALWVTISRFSPLGINDSGEKLICGGHGCIYLCHSSKQQATDPSKPAWPWVLRTVFWKNKTKSKTKMKDTRSIETGFKNGQLESVKLNHLAVCILVHQMANTVCQSGFELCEWIGCLVILHAWPWPIEDYGQRN